MSTPTCVQHVLWHSNCNFENGNAFKLPVEATLSGNCLVLFLTYAYSAGRTVAITDNIGNTWPSTPTLKADDTANALTTAVFVLPNATAGVAVLTVTFDAAIMGVAPAFSEWYNVATSSPLDGTGSAAAVVVAAAVTSGSFTTGVAGSVVLQHVIDTNWGTQLEGAFFDSITGIAKNTGYTMLHADVMNGEATQYQVQSSAGATNPAITFSGGSAGSVSFNSITIALKSATSGTAPAAGMRIFGKYHTRLKTPTVGAANYPVWLPTTGSLAVLASAYGSNGTVINSGTGATSGAWTLLGVGQPSDYPQMLYKASLTPSDGEVLTLNLTKGGSGDLQFIVYDIVSGGAFSNSLTANSAPYGPGTVSNLPSITPGISAGLAIGALGCFTGPPDAASAPSGVVFDSGFYTGYSDLSPFDSGDGYAHYYFSSNAVQNWAWHDTAATSASNATVAIFGPAVAGPTINQQPASVSITDGDSAYLQTVATTSGGALSYQWKDNRGGSFANCSDGAGATAQTYVTAALVTANTGRQYECVVTDSNGSTTSNAVAITVVAKRSAKLATFDQEMRVDGWF